MTPSTQTFAVVLAGALAAAGCGAGTKFANKPRPPTPVNLSVYIGNARLSLSPGSVGAGPIVLIVTNQASRTESLTVAPADGGSRLASTGPIAPQATAQVQIDLESPGVYTVATGSDGTTAGSLAMPATIRAASLHIGRKRPSASGALLQP